MWRTVKLDDAIAFCAAFQDYHLPIETLRIVNSNPTLGIHYALAAFSIETQPKLLKTKELCTAFNMLLVHEFKSPHFTKEFVRDTILEILETRVPAALSAMHELLKGTLILSQGWPGLLTRLANHLLDPQIVDLERSEQLKNLCAALKATIELYPTQLYRNEPTVFEKLLKSIKNIHENPLARGELLGVLRHALERRELIPHLMDEIGDTLVDFLQQYCIDEENLFSLLSKVSFLVNEESSSLCNIP